MKQWQWIAALAGGAVVVMGGVVLLQKSASAATPTANNNTVDLQPGATTIAPTKGSSVSLLLPAGASWIDVKSGNSTVVPSGVMTFTASDDAQLVASWNLNGVLQQATINVVPLGS